MGYTLGDAAPPYIVIALGVAMLTAIATTHKEYRAYNVRMDKIKVLKWITISLFFDIYFFCTIILLAASIINIFILNWPCLLSDYINLFIKISLALCSVCFTYCIGEFLRKHKEFAEDNDRT